MLRQYICYLVVIEWNSLRAAQVRDRQVVHNGLFGRIKLECAKLSLIVRSDSHGLDSRYNPHVIRSDRLDSDRHFKR